MVNGLVRQMVGFVEDINRVLRRRQNRAATEGEIRQHQIVVGDYAIQLVEGIPRLEKCALADKAAAPPRALAVVRGHPGPGALRQFLRPVIAIPVPAAFCQLLHHGVVEGFVLGRDPGTGVVVEKHQLFVAVRENPVELAEAQIATAPFDEAVIEIEAAVLFDVRQILKNDLLLQGNGCGGYHHLFAKSLGRRQSGEQIGDGFASAGARLDHANVAVTSALRLIIQANAAERSRDSGDH